MGKQKYGLEDAEGSRHVDIGQFSISSAEILKRNPLALYHLISCGNAKKAEKFKSQGPLLCPLTCRKCILQGVKQTRTQLTHYYRWK